MSVRLTYFVHSITTDNEEGVATGWLSGKLSEEGLKRARVMRPVMDMMNFDVVFCSDLTRAVESADIFFGGRYRIVQDERLRECNYGDQNGGSAKEVKKDMLTKIHEPFQNGESYSNVESRIADFCGFLKENYEGKRVAVVSHQAPQLALDVLVKKLTWEQSIEGDWRKDKAWQPGWEYIIE